MSQSGGEPPCSGMTTTRLIVRRFFLRKTDFYYIDGRFSLAPSVPKAVETSVFCESSERVTLFHLRMIRRLLSGLVLVICSIPLSLQAQNQIVQGQVLNDQTGEPVPFATLGIPGRSIGTVADEQGHYLLRLPPDLRDTLVVTSVGFARTAVPPAALAGGQRVFRLRPQGQLLRDVVVQRRPVPRSPAGPVAHQGRRTVDGWLQRQGNRGRRVGLGVGHRAAPPAPHLSGGVSRVSGR